ncbi:LPS assembly lipoprotein LptE [Campylobacter sp. RM16192]|uniref:LPS assembly lipoprotein LptE n=1 Tax=Campylobacter sp. RM16192 TaxID=1660080 RepID=UPI0014517C3C|nr:LPS assembly lipoprotein LptE [Campylobacter sp. RM16192]QCD52300.1 putative lipooligosaccharide transport system, OM component (LptE family) [Campylobacter sp. RM16192]
MRFVAAIFIAVFLIGCGYKPLSKITKDIMGEDVYVHVVIDRADPKSSVWIADSIKEGIVSRLNRKLSGDKNAKTKIIASVKSVNLQALLYDEDGYVSLYKAVLKMEFDTKLENGKSHKSITTGEYDFTISKKIKDIRYADSVISETDRYNAIKEASKEAFEEYLAVLAVKGFKNVINNY